MSTTSTGSATHPRRREIAWTLATVLALLTALLATAAPSAAGGHDPASCRPDDRRLQVPAGFFLDSCFDGTYLVLFNRTDLPVYVDLTGDLVNAGKQRYAGTAHYASDIVTKWAPHLLVPDFQMRIKVGSAGGTVSLGYADDTGRKFEMLRQASAFVPSILAAPDVVAQFLTEADNAYVQLLQCEQKPHQNFLDRAWCGTVFVGDLVFANTRLAVNGVLTFTGLKLWLGALKHFAETGNDLRNVNNSLHEFYSASRSFPVPAGLTGTAPGGTSTPKAPPPSKPSAPASALTFSLHGTCTSSGGTITSTSGGFTPGGRYTIGAWYPNGNSYSLGSGSGGTVHSDGTITWKWPCAGDPAGRYTTQVTDNATGRTTGKVPFTIGSAPTSAPTSPSSTPAPTARTYTERSGSHGSPTFTNYTNASGQGQTIPAYGYVEVSCKVHPPTTIASANPDGYWYRIASSPWNNAYYAVANTFWNGDVPGQTPYTHNTDFNVPDC